METNADLVPPAGTLRVRHEHPDPSVDVRRLGISSGTRLLGSTTAMSQLWQRGTTGVLCGTPHRSLCATTSSRADPSEQAAQQIIAS
jgi:hypothetical protein